MSSSSPQDPPAQRGSFGSTVPSRQLPINDPMFSKRVCFYKSGDYTFGGHRMVINARTFKTFEALLDALSKKVPLAFGVRTITTPRGIHYVRGLDDLFDGGSYVCSDQKRIKPLNLQEVNRRQVPWNTARPVSARKKRQGLVIQAMRKVTKRVAVRTPKRLEVIKNRDPTVKRTIVLQRRTAPTFDALLDYLSQTLQFPVLKLYAIDGRRIDGLAALILCSGVIVAAGNEPFRLGQYRFQRSAQITETTEASQPQAYTNKPLLNGRTSRNFSMSSEHYIVNQINKSRNENTDAQHIPNGPVSDPETSIEILGNAKVENECHSCIVPQDEDIEKSFRVNQDGSMTVEMKVRLSIKEEEMLHWTTTLSRTSLRKRTAAYPLVSASGNSSSESNNAMAKPSNVNEGETKKVNHPASEKRNSIEFIEEKFYETPKVIEINKSTFRRPPTPGPRHHVKKKAVKMVAGSKAEDIDQYTYMKRTSDNDTTEGYCVVRHSSSRSNRPIPKPRKNTANNDTSSIGVAEVLQVEHSALGVRETVMHIYESQGCYETYFENEDSLDSMPLSGSSQAAKPGKLATDTRQSSSNDCDIDSTWQPPGIGTMQHQNEEILSLSSESLSNSYRIKNNLSSIAKDSLAQTMPLQEKIPKDSNKKMTKSVQKQKLSANSVDKKPAKVVGPSKNSQTSVEKNNTVGKKSSTDSVKSGQKSLKEKMQAKKLVSDTSPVIEKVVMQNVKITKSTNKVAPYNGHNVNVPETKIATNKMKKNISDIWKPKKSVSASQKTVSSKTKSADKSNISSRKKSTEVSESVSMPLLNPSPSNIHRYVENWLEKVSPDAVPYMEEEEDLKSQGKVMFQLGADSEGEDKNPSEFYIEKNCASKMASNLLVPSCQGGPVQSEISVSMPSFGVASEDASIRPHKSADAFHTIPDNISSPKAKLEPVLRQICTSVQCINSGTSDTNATPNIPKSNSLPDFPFQVASVFGSSCKAFLSFLSMMTLRDSLTGFAGPSHDNGSAPRMSSEAMLMMESLQKISTIDNDKEQWASLSDLQNKASMQFKEEWQDYQQRRERLESETLSPKSSALEVVSDSVFDEEQLGISEIMNELNMPEDLRAEISTAIQQAITFYPTGESIMAEIEQNQCVENQCLKTEIAIEEQAEEILHVAENSNQEVHLGEVLQNKSDAMMKDEVAEKIEEVSSGQESKDSSVKDDRPLEIQSLEDLNEGLDNSICKEQVADDQMTIEGSEGAIEKEVEEGTLDSMEDGQQSGSISEKIEKEVTDQLEETDVDSVEQQYDPEVLKEEESQDTGQEMYSDELAGSGEEQEKTLLQEKSSEDEDICKTDKDLDDEESEGDEEAKFVEKCEQGSVGSLPKGATSSQNVLEEALYLENSSCDEAKMEEISNIKHLSQNLPQDTENCNGNDSISELDTVVGDHCCCLSNTVEISEELLDFVNSALLSSSIIFTYDSQGNIKVAQNQKLTSKNKNDSEYGYECLLSPNTSELSDYRPESFDSGENKSQDSLDIVTESEDDQNNPFKVCKHSAQKMQNISNNGRESYDKAESKLSSSKSKSMSSNGSESKKSNEDMSNFSTASSSKADNEPTQDISSSVLGKHSPEGILIDQGRWLLKENHLIRRSPPVSSVGLYGQIDNTSIDSSLIEDSPPHYEIQHNPVTALSSSELEEMAKPKTPKCHYYNMPHGSDSDPFLDNASVKSGQNGVKIDTTKTWANKNGSLSSFASVEFKMLDRKVHPEGESSAVVQARRPSSGERSELQQQDSVETIRWRCGQYCPIL